MGTAVHTDLDFTGGAKLTGLPQSAANGQAVVHEQLQAAIEGVAWKDSVRVSTQGNLNLASPGATIDGITMAANDRFLARSQTTQSQNGIYIWNGAATPATRAADASTFAELEAAVVTVEEGTDAGAGFRQTQVNGTIDTNNVVWASFGTSVPAASETTAGVAELATQAETNTGTDDLRIVTPLKLASSNFAKKKFSQAFGDGSATQYDITHNLNTLDVIVSVRVAATDKEIICDITRTSVNVVRLNLASAPASNAMEVTIIG
jgi:hypothetical protein